MSAFSLAIRLSLNKLKCSLFRKPGLASIIVSLFHRFIVSLTPTSVHFIEMHFVSFHFTASHVK